MTGFLQANLNRAKAAQALLLQTMYEQKADVAIISEPNKIPNSDGWYGSTDQSCCLLLSKDVEVTNNGRGEGYVWVDIQTYRVYSCYFSPSKKHSLEEYRAYLGRLSDSIREGPTEYIVAGDFNAHSPSWDSPSTCAKGEALTDFASAICLIVINQGTEPTYERGGRSSHIDVTFASTGVSKLLYLWQVLQVNMASDHHPVVFKLGCAAKPTQPHTKGWSWRRLDKDKLTSFLRAAYPAGQTIFVDVELANFLESACDSCMPRKSFHGHTKRVHWWTEEIAALREFSTLEKISKGSKTERIG